MTVQAERASREFMAVAEQLPALFDLTAADIATLGDLTLAYGTEVDPEDPDADEKIERRDAAIARLEEQFNNNDALVVRKIERYIHVLESQTMLMESFKARAKRLRDHASAIERGQDHLKAKLMQAMKAMGRESVATPAGIVSIRTNAPSCVVLEEMMVPAMFKKTVVTTTVDKNAVKLWVKETGEVVPGVSIERSESLTVR